MNDLVLMHTRDDRGVHTLTLNNPRAFNVLSEAMMAAFQQALDAVAADPAARAVVIAAEGRAFCAGHDLKEMKARPELAYYQSLFATCSKLMLSIRKLEVPVIPPQVVETLAELAARAEALAARVEDGV